MQLRIESIQINQILQHEALSQLGGEKDVIAKLKLGAIQGMMSSSVAFI